jgi:hypothetical protein
MIPNFLPQTGPENPQTAGAACHAEPPRNGAPVLLGQLHRVGQSRGARWHAGGARFCQGPARTAGVRVRAGERRAGARGCLVGSHGGARADAQELPALAEPPA